MVVVVILIKQGPYQRMIMPQLRAKTSQAPASGAPTKQESPAPAELDKGGAADLQGNAGVKAKKEQEGASGSEKGNQALREEPKAPAATDEEERDRLAKRADEVARKTEPAPARVGNVATLGAAESATPGALKEEIPPSPGYATILTRYGLPPVWDASHVSAEALANAEPDLRSLYMSGSAGSDSGRVRLYLAEAARLRYAPGDSVLYDEILRHYRRAIALGGPYSRIARIAEERLRTLGR
jgi:hypothetical protein